MSEIITELEREFDQRVAELDPFDAGVWLGYAAKARVAYPDATALKTGLERSGVRRALVSHKMGELHDAGQGNDALTDTLAELDGFAGAMTLLPSGNEALGNLENYIDGMLAKGMRAARIFPKAHRFTLRIPAADALLRLLEARGIALLIPIGQTSWDEIGALAGKYPKLAILVESIGHHEYLNIRGALSWLEAAPNLLVPTNNQFLPGGLELLVERLGAHRVFFSSNQPIDSPAATLSLLGYSELPMADRAKIAHQNLEHLLSGIDQGGYLA